MNTVLLMMGAIVSKEVKKRKESIEDYIKGGREDIANQLNEGLDDCKDSLFSEVSISSLICFARRDSVLFFHASFIR